MVVDEHGKKIFQNRRLIDLWKIPQHITQDPDDSKQVDEVLDAVEKSASESVRKRAREVRQEREERRAERGPKQEVK